MIAVPLPQHSDDPPAVERLVDESLPIAEVHRRVAALASHLGYSRPSYEQIRVLVREHRGARFADRRPEAPTTLPGSIA